MEKLKNIKSLDKSIDRENNEFNTENPEEKEINTSSRNIKNIMRDDKLINISTTIEENLILKDKFQIIQNLKESVILLRNELDRIILASGNINLENQGLCRLYNEGINEISREIFKIYETQPNRNLKRNDLYNGLIKGRNQHCKSISENYHSDTIHQAKTINNIKQKYKGNVFENIEPNNVIFNVVTNLFKENKHLYQKYRIKKKKLDWDEFKELKSYQIFALLFINEVDN